MKAIKLLKKTAIFSIIFLFLNLLGQRAIAQPPQCPPTTVYIKWYWKNNETITTAPTGSGCTGTINYPPIDEFTYDDMVVRFYSDAACLYPVNVNMYFGYYGSGATGAGGAGTTGTFGITNSFTTTNIVNSYYYFIPNVLKSAKLAEQDNGGNCTNFTYAADHTFISPCVNNLVVCVPCSGGGEDPCDLISPVITKSASEVCEPNSITICAAATGLNYTYEWSDGTNTLPPSTDNCITLANPFNGEISCKITNPVTACAVNSLKTTIKINPLPVKTVQATYSGTSNVELCSYQTAPGSTYQWYRSGSIISGAISRCYTTGSNGNYYCYVTTPEGCSRYSDTTIVLGLLAVKINDFTGKKESGKYNTLQWVLSDLTDFESLHLELSYNNSTFKEIFKSTSVNVLTYKHEESKPSYYRLVIKNKAGKNTYSKIVYVDNKSTDLTNISPNPTSGVCNIFINTKTQQDVSITIYDSNGKLVLTEKKSIQRGQNNIITNISNSAPGLYMITIKGNTINQSIKIVKK